MLSMTVILLLCALVALLMHVMKPSGVPLWISMVFVIVAILISALPIK